MLHLDIFNVRQFKLTFVFLLIVSGLHAQSTNVSTLFHSDLKKADSFYDMLAYPNALNFYLRVVEKDPTNKAAKDRIVDCYIRLGNYKEAATWLENILLAATATPIDHFHYAQVLSVLGKYDEALLAYRTYEQLTKADPRAASKVDFLRQLEYHLRDSNLYTVRHEWFNSDQSDFAPTYYEDGIVFVSARDRDLFIKKKSLSALNEKESLLNAFFAHTKYDSSLLPETQVKLFYNKDLNTPYHDGPVSFYEQRKRIAFSRNVMRNGRGIADSKGKVNLELFFAKLNDDKSLTEIDAFPYNDTEYTLAHPWISEAGDLLFFSSNMPGGLGGADLYFSRRVDRKWSKPVNLGSRVNTSGDEFYPYVFSDSLLFFSSNGHGGFGGLDNFVCKVKGDSFGEAQNLSFPLNSSMDDFGLRIDSTGRNGIFSSNRPGGLGYDDIYSYSLNFFTLLGTVVELGSDKSIPGAKIIVKDSLGHAVDSVTSDTNGNFFLNLNFDRNYDLAATKDGYSSLESIGLSTHHWTVITDTLAIPIWKNNLFAEGVIYSNESQSILPGATVVIENLDAHKKDSLVVGADGKYNFLVYPNTRYRISAWKNGFIRNGFDLNTKGIMEGKLVNDILLEEVFMEKLIVYFDLDKKDIKNQFVKDLDKIARDLKRSGKATLYIGAHADTQGTNKYNLALSNARAKTLMDFFVSRGIVVKRIEAIGFGEELVLNQCSEGVTCSDEEHGLNRRAEIKMQMPE